MNCKIIVTSPDLYPPL